MILRNIVRSVFFCLATAATASAATNWTLNTADTRITVGVNASGALSISELRCPAAGWNWAATPSTFPLVSRVDAGGTQYAPAWIYINGTVETLTGTQVTITFTNANPAMLLTSIWQARPGPGPVHHAMFIKNTGAQTITLYEQESIDVHVVAPTPNASMWHFSDDGQQAQDQGTFHDMLTSGFSHTIYCSEGNVAEQTLYPGNVRNGQDDIPYAVIDAGASNGVYVGWEWSIGRIEVSAYNAPSGAYVKAGNRDDFKTDVDAGETFLVPPGFIGAYKGDVDDAGNSLRKYLFNYNMPATVRDDASYPKVEWNAFNATGGWSPTETNYRPFIDGIVTMGFEEVMIDVAWWDGDAFTYNLPPRGDPVRWPSDMHVIRDYAHDRGLRFGLYWAHRAYMTTTNGIGVRKAEVTYLYDHFQTDIYRSDAMGCGVLQYGPVGPLPFPNAEDQTASVAHYEEDKNYYQTKGFYEVLDSLAASITNFSYENCAAGGTIKDFGIMKRSFKIQNSDQYRPLDCQRAFYDTLYALPPVQVSGVVSKYDDADSGSVASMKYWFRSASMGAARIEPDPATWNTQKSNDCAAAVATYKAKIRPLIRSANVYHVFPRPDNTVWTGMQFHDPITAKGVVFVFRPNNASNTYTVKLKGLDEATTYAVTSEDGSVSARNQTGDDLMQNGVPVQLNSIFSSDLIFVEAAASAVDPDEWTAYNDFAIGPGQMNNLVTSNSPATLLSGSLKDNVTGTFPLNASVRFSIAGGTASSYVTNAGTPMAGSDADQLFGGKVDCTGYAYWTAGTVTLVLTNLNPASRYDFALYGSRGSTAASYQTRYAQVTLAGASSFTNVSSAGATITTVTLPNDTTRIYATNVVGWVHRYANINPGADGTVVFSIVGDGNGSYLNAFRLQATTPVVVDTNDWIAYNDCAWTNGDAAGGIFTTNSPSSLLNGALRDTDGSTLPVQVTFATGSALGVSLLGQNSQLGMGTDAATWFAGKIGTNGISQWTNGSVQMSFSGLNTSRQYNIVIWSTRGGSGASYSNRFTDITISGADVFVNRSSTGTELSTVSIANDRTRVRASVTPGLVTRYDNVRPGSNGLVAFTLTAGADLLWPANPTTPYGYLNAFMIQTVPLSDSSTNAIPDNWLIQYFGGPSATNGGTFDDFDHDGSSNYAEYRAGTDPTQAGSKLEMTGIAATNSSNTVVLRWAGVSGKTYAVLQATNVVGTWTTVASGIPGVAPVTTYTGTVSTTKGFWRVKVE